MKTELDYQYENLSLTYDNINALVKTIDNHGLTESLKQLVGSSLEDLNLTITDIENSTEDLVDKVKIVIRQMVNLIKHMWAVLIDYIKKTVGTHARMLKKIKKHVYKLAKSGVDKKAKSNTDIYTYELLLLAQQLLLHIRLNKGGVAETNWIDFSKGLLGAKELGVDLSLKDVGSLDVSKMSSKLTKIRSFESAGYISDPEIINLMTNYIAYYTEYVEGDIRTQIQNTIASYDSKIDTFDVITHHSPLLKEHVDGMRRNVKSLSLQIKLIEKVINNINTTILNIKGNK